MTPNPTPPVVIVPTPPPSPTGEAVFKLPPWAAWLLVGVGAASAAVSQLPQLIPGLAVSPKIQAAALLVSLALASMGVVSAGGRKAMAIIVVLGASLALPGCATMGGTEQAQLIDCGEKALASTAESLAPQLGTVLAGASPNWNADAGELIVAGGMAAVCALEVVIAGLERPTPTLTLGAGGGAAPVSTDVALVRAIALKTRLKPYRVK